MHKNTNIVFTILTQTQPGSCCMGTPGPWLGGQRLLGELQGGKLQLIEEERSSYNNKYQSTR